MTPTPLHPRDHSGCPDGDGASSAPGGSGDGAWHSTPTRNVALPAAIGTAEPRRGWRGAGEGLRLHAFTCHLIGCIFN